MSKYVKKLTEEQLAEWQAGAGKRLAGIKRTFSPEVCAARSERMKAYQEKVRAAMAAMKKMDDEQDKAEANSQQPGQ